MPNNRDNLEWLNTYIKNHTKQSKNLKHANKQIGDNAPVIKIIKKIEYLKKAIRYQKNNGNKVYHINYNDAIKYFSIPVALRKKTTRQLNNERSIKYMIAHNITPKNPKINKNFHNTNDKSM